MEPHICYTEHGRVLKRSLSQTFGKDYAGFAKLEGRLKRWYRESDMALLSAGNCRSRLTIGDDVYDIKGLFPGTDPYYFGRAAS